MKRGWCAGGLAIAVVVGLTGCAAPDADASWTPPRWDAGSVAVSAMPEPVDAAAVPILDGRRIRNDAVGVQARWMQLPGDTPFDDRVAEVVRTAVDERAAAAGVAYTPAASSPGGGMTERDCVTGSTVRDATALIGDAALGPAGGDGAAVVCDIVLAAGSHLGQRIRVVTSDATGITSDEATVVYADVASGDAATGDELWADGAVTALYQDLVNVLRRPTGSLSQIVQPPDEAQQALLADALAQTSVAADGSLVVPVPAGFSSPELRSLGVEPTTEAVPMGVPPEAHQDLVSPFGAAVVSAAQTDAAFAAPPPVNAGAESVDCTLLACVALTYDDGPSEWTPGILDQLNARRASATFFVVGERVRFNGETLRRMIAEGHLAENHTWNHPMLPRLSTDAVIAQISDTSAAIEAATGVAPTVFRPPYGEYDERVLQAAGMAAILWDVDSLDYAKVSDATVLSRVVGSARPGSIVLQHDIQENTVRTVGAVYDGLLDRGFVLVNLTQLFGGTLPTSGAVRSGPR